jgi:hypothetical protein
MRDGANYPRKVIADALRDLREGVLEDPKDFVHDPDKLERKLVQRMERIERAVKKPLGVVPIKLPRKKKELLVPKFKKRKK